MSTPERRCTLVVPALFRPASTSIAVPVLEMLCARGQRLAPLAPGVDAALFDLFGLSSTSPLPIAAIARLGEASPPPVATWLRADPVYLQLDGARMRLLGSAPLQLTRDEAQALVTELAPLFADVADRLEAAHPERWYLALRTLPQLQVEPLSAVLGGDVDTHLPRGADARAWRRLLNEVQMTLHASPVNAAREARGQLPVNSVWFWGLGALPPAPTLRWARVWSDAPTSRGLGRLSGSGVHALPRTGSDWLSEASEGGDHLLVLGDADEPGEFNDGGAHDAWLTQVEADWARPLADAVRAGGLASLCIVSDTGPAVRVTAGALRRWWRRRQPLSHYSK